MEKVKAESSTIDEIEYDSEKNELFVTFKNGKKYKYSEVNDKVFRDFIEADSQGKFFTTNIKNSFKYQLVN